MMEVPVVALTKITGARFDPRMWTLDLTVTDGEKTETIDYDLTKYDGWGIDGDALKRTQICECAAMVFFPDFPAPGAMITFEPIDGDN
jgi:hypothetical protein